ncbi:MAG: AsmA family protein [Acidobacteriia bacterium]|nr:AsmA family protein [Terriglobia bacterium]
MKWLRIVGIAVAVLVVAALALPFFINANQFRPILEERLTAALGREVKIGDLKLSLFSGGASASDVTIADDPAFSKEPFLRAKDFAVGVELWPLIFSHQLNVTSLTIDQPEIGLIQSAAGDWNFSSLGGKAASTPTAASPASTTSSGAAPTALSVKLVKISKGRLTLSNGTKAKPRTLENVNIELRDFSATSSFPFSLAADVAGGGSVKLEGKAGPIPQADVIQTPFDLNLTIGALDLAGSGFAQPSSGIAGIVSLDGNAASNGHAVNIKGKLKADSLKLATGGSPAKRAVEIDLALSHDLAKQGGTLERCVVHIGAAQANLSGTYRLNEDSPVISVKLAGTKMALTELAAMLPALDVVLPAGSNIERGTLTMDVASLGPIDRLVTTGSIHVDDARLNNFDLGSKMKTIQQLAGIQGEPRTTIQTLSANVAVSPEGTNVRDIKVVAPAVGDLTGSGTISPRHELNFQMRATVRASSHILTAIGQKGDVTIPFSIAGTSSDPSFKPDVKGAAKETLQQYTKDPSKAIDAAKGILDMFKKPKDQPPPQQQK